MRLQFPNEIQEKNVRENSWKKWDIHPNIMLQNIASFSFALSHNWANIYLQTETTNKSVKVLIAVGRKIMQEFFEALWLCEVFKDLSQRLHQWRLDEVALCESRWGSLTNRFLKSTPRALTFRTEIKINYRLFLKNERRITVRFTDWCLPLLWEKIRQFALEKSLRDPFDLTIVLTARA